MRTPLFPNPAKVVTDAIRNLQSKLKMPPTIMELREYLNVGSTRTVLRYLRQAENAGLIRRWHGARGIAVLSSGKSNR